MCMMYRRGESGVPSGMKEEVVPEGVVSILNKLSIR